MNNLSTTHELEAAEEPSSNRSSPSLSDHEQDYQVGKKTVRFSRDQLHHLLAFYNKYSSAKHWPKSGSTDSIDVARASGLTEKQVRVFCRNKKSRDAAKRRLAMKMAKEKSRSMHSQTVPVACEKEETGTDEEKRFTWNADLRKWFDEAVRQLTPSREATPRKILAYLRSSEKKGLLHFDTSKITRHHVASHLQKYRIRQQKLTDASAGEQSSVDSSPINRPSNHLLANNNFASLERLMTDVQTMPTPMSNNRLTPPPFHPALPSYLNQSVPSASSSFSQSLHNHLLSNPSIPSILDSFLLSAKPQHSDRFTPLSSVASSPRLSPLLSPLLSFPPSPLLSRSSTPTFGSQNLPYPALPLPFPSHSNHHSQPRPSVNSFAYLPAAGPSMSPFASPVQSPLLHIPRPFQTGASPSLGGVPNLNSSLFSASGLSLPPLRWPDSGYTSRSPSPQTQSYHSLDPFLRSWEPSAVPFSSSSSSSSFHSSQPTTSGPLRPVPTTPRQNQLPPDFLKSLYNNSKDKL
eukprot:GILK01005347.1.p1 GENE.GILK01005347.1~~GILK01005347.1.p1  ORF type:complete len:519 (+),score=42.04 GILK01005347.1:89-1645(+)